MSPLFPFNNKLAQKRKKITDIIRALLKVKTTAENHNINRKGIEYFQYLLSYILKRTKYTEPIE